MSTQAEQDWWRQAVVYQVYPRSFADSDADGIGDLPGVASRIPYLADLGVDALWLSPFYPSRLADGGYDIDDHRAVDPALGTMDDFDALAGAAQAAGLKLVIDIVANHTSDRHAWFREAIDAPKGSPARDRYVIRDGSGPGGTEPPSDWTSILGGLDWADGEPAWTRLPDGQWYLHLFTPQQPDLNWTNDEVRGDFLTTLAFWADRGVSGFRVDVAHLLAKDMSLPLPLRAEVDRDLGTGHHRYVDRDEVHEIYRQWRQLFNRYDPPLTAVAEASAVPERRSRYASQEGLGQAFNFDLLMAPWRASAFRDVITANLAQTRNNGSTNTWVFSNHDVVRHASRYGLPEQTDLNAWLLSGGLEPPLDVERGLRRARAATLLALALPGSSYLYQGEELGLQEVADLPEHALQDPMWTRTGHQTKGRDGARVPLPWTADGSSFGFGDNGAHLPQPPWFTAYAVATQAADHASTLHLYRAALRARRQLQTEEDLTWSSAGEQVLAFRRPNGWCSVTNFGPPTPMPAGQLVLASSPLDGGLLPTDSTAWLKADPR